MTSWVYIFSQFTPEALLFEGFFIFLLVCLYAAFWVLRKRRYGSVDANLPSGPVKSYLNELIANAEHLRLQLFGLLSSAEYLSNPKPMSPSGLPLPDGATLVADPDATKKLAQLELKFTEQSKTLELLNDEKTKLEKELTDARNNAPSSGSASEGGNSGEESATISKLQQKIQDLESRLAEYNVIEDDLANLKRLQQENAQLKAQLSGKEGSTPAASATTRAAPSPAETPAAEAPAPAKSAPAPTPLAATSDPVDLSEASAQPTAPDASASLESSSEDVFESLAGQIESSLQESLSTSSTPAEGQGPNAAPSSTKSETENAEADLVAEFEKMLKG